MSPAPGERGLLLDSHVAMWWLADSGRLGPSVRSAIADPGNRLVVSAASVWELHIKQAKGKLRISDRLSELLGGRGVELLDITAAHARRAAALPPHHGDPFDRMLVAQAQAEGLRLVTCDQHLLAYDDEIWLDSGA